MSEDHGKIGKAVRWFTIIAAATTLLLFPSFSAAMGGGSEETAATTTTTTVITRQESSNGQNGTDISSVIIDRSQGADDGIGSLTDDIEDRIDELISSATNNTAGGEVIDMQISGKIASARINLDSGQVEQTFFGDWSVDVQSINNASFLAEFAASNGSNGEDAHYRIGNLSLTSFQRINDHAVLGGTVDVAEEMEAQSWEETAVSILVISNRAIAMIFEEPELDEAFSGQPITGVATGIPAQ